MVRITRLLTFEEYVASNRLLSLHTTFRHKLNYFVFLYIAPVVACFGFLLGVYNFVQAWRAVGDHGSAVALWGGLIGGCASLIVYPFRFQRRLRKLYRDQELDMPWTLEVSDEGVRSIRPGRSDTRLEWGFFSGYVDDAQFFCMLRGKRPAFVSISKRTLTDETLEELKTILAAHLHLLS